MSPPAGTSLFMRFFGLIENYPLYLMVGTACGLAAYTPVRHLATAPDIALDRAARDHSDHLAENPRMLARARNYEGGILGTVASWNNWPEVIRSPSDIDPNHHFHHERWPAPRPFEVPQAPAN